MAEDRKRYTQEFKVQAVAMLNRGEKSGHEIQRDLGIARPRRRRSSSTERCSTIEGGYTSRSAT